jgi:hypothetical protein
MFSMTEIKTEDLTPKGQTSLNDVSDKWPRIKAELEIALEDVLKKIEDFYTQHSGVYNDETWMTYFVNPLAWAKDEWRRSLSTQQEAILKWAFPAITVDDKYPLKIVETFSDQNDKGLEVFYVTYNVSVQNSSERKYKVQWKLSFQTTRKDIGNDQKRGRGTSSISGSSNKSSGAPSQAGTGDAGSDLTSLARSGDIQQIQPSTAESS